MPTSILSHPLAASSDSWSGVQPAWLPRRTTACVPLEKGSTAAPVDPAKESSTSLGIQIRDLHDELVERAFRLDRRGRADAADEVNAVARKLQELLSK